MADILFLAHRIPYPPNKGDKIRSWHVLAHLSERHRVHLGCFIDDPADRTHRAYLAARCATCRFIDLNPLLAKMKSLPGLLTGAPLSLGYYGSRAMRRWVAATLAAHPVGAIVAVCSSMAPYALPHAGKGNGNGKGMVTLIDFIDVDSEKWRQYAAAGRWPLSAIYGREARRLLAFERHAAAACDQGFFVSEAEAALFRRLAPEAAARVAVLENGVDTDYFDPACPVGPTAVDGGPVVAFTGAMDYWANVDAVSWFVSGVWPRLRAVHPHARFFIVGGKPAAAVQALARQPGVVVTGRVDDVRPYLKAADVAVAPMRVARGVQNKVLEAMAMGLPVVTTPAGLEGIDARAGEHLLVAADAGAFAQAVLDMLADAKRAAAIGQAARARAVARYGWTATLAPLARWLGESD